MKKLKPDDGTTGTQRDEKIVRAGVANNVVRERRRRKQATDGIATRVRDEVQSALGVAKLNFVGRGKELARLPQRDGRAALCFKPTRLLMNEHHDNEQYRCAIGAQEHWQFQQATHRTAKLSRMVAVRQARSHFTVLKSCHHALISRL